MVSCGLRVGGGATGLINIFPCFATNFTSISCSSETTKGRGRGGKSIHFLKALFIINSTINVSRLWIRRYLKYSAPKFRTSRCYTNSLKMNVFFHLSVEVTKILSTALPDKYNSFL